MATRVSLGVDPDPARAVHGRAARVADCSGSDTARGTLHTATAKRLEIAVRTATQAVLELAATTYRA